MKYCIIIPDGMADYQIEKLGGKTPLEAAETPNFDTIASQGLTGLVHTVPEAFAPGSDIACLSVLGYDPSVYYTGRAPLEAASLGIKLRDEDWAIRCNLITRNSDILEDFCAGHITNKEAGDIISTLNEKLGNDTIQFHAGKSYRNILIYRGNRSIDADCTPPHDIIGQSIESNLPRGNGEELLIDLMMKSYEILSDHSVNRVRRGLNQKPANMIWLWGQGKRPTLPFFKEIYHLSGAVITGVDLLKGLGVILGWEIIDVPGATGYLDTDYDAKARYAIEAFNTHDLVLIHVEAPDEAGHEGNIGEKIRAIENIDSKIVGPLHTALKKFGNFRMLILPDHYTPIQERTHTREPVPFAMYGADFHEKSTLAFSESNAALTNLEIHKGHTLMRHFIEGTLSSS
ncbi:MAG: cofactor-independent phosphoglycerate mutase [Candidatus Scalindua sp. AMX11]|nr:MAG: cofactor-independent phosphoglycerate mutase [Candidatus Scalindua sp.]NOG85728.1 cofactor-independent phosphoglycerate mutase [Planctomycetota bacterium]RZV73176.1 MAG: cofactor-independent phosphoglycerate mutase [Candidatus Scalindua sp. SCAELEC01]TDE64735.1 MAG: cofactor-independent phosphoglycerate mutase [Candidatus Scalindua sp. AMX11]GJQ58702.1 MAG: homoserine kinase [Candidatus Scalindua sp.]